jgi:hypothetical protein
LVWRTIFSLALFSYLVILSVADFRDKVAKQPLLLVEMAEGLRGKLEPGVLCTSKPHLARLLDMKFVPLRADWTFDSLRAQGVDYALLGPLELGSRPGIAEVFYTGQHPDFVEEIAHWNKYDTILLRIKR